MLKVLCLFLSMSLIFMRLYSVCFMTPSHTHAGKFTLLKHRFSLSDFFFLYLGVYNVFLLRASFLCLTWKAFCNLTLTVFSGYFVIKCKTKHYRQLFTDIEQMQFPMYFVFQVYFWISVFYPRNLILPGLWNLPKLTENFCSSFLCSAWVSIFV